MTMKRRFFDDDIIKELEAKLAIVRVLEPFTPGDQVRVLREIVRMLGAERTLEEEERVILGEFDKKKG